ncbi:hypothetical protein QO010_000445 [Caulobacter ginsengisoli]|uniref:TIGR02301 family protein n=1 Tax=Caulobacter ginsengisoli TaxID=400775 RepID=A0ABU0IL12_9CAUL|nr:hypothetical protein [Caulobacter ginsengisoli]MDQ0462697.1 hypothetical protein [Caulobacter ginsengisoli]
MNRKTVCCAALLLLTLSSPAFSGPGTATPPTDNKARVAELLRWGICAAALAVYNGVLEDEQGTAADRDLLARAKAAEPRMKAWFDTIGNQLDDSQTDAVEARITDPVIKRISRYKDDPDRAAHLLADFRPDLETCIAEAATLPEPPPQGETAT